MDTQALLPATKTFKKRASIKQSNELTEAAYYLPLQAKRVLWLCLMQAYFNDSQEDDSDVLPLFKISVSDYVKYFNVATSVASRDVKAGVNALGESTVTFYPKEGEFEEVKRPWLAEAGMKRGRGSWQIEFNYKVMPFLVGLTSQFTTYSLYDCGQLNSVRVIRGIANTNSATLPSSTNGRRPKRSLSKPITGWTNSIPIIMAIIISTPWSSE